jgi:hypothetical protein
VGRYQEWDNVRGIIKPFSEVNYLFYCFVQRRRKPRLKPECQAEQFLRLNCDSDGLKIEHIDDIRGN